MLLFTLDGMMEAVGENFWRSFELEYSLKRFMTFPSGGAKQLSGRSGSEFHGEVGATDEAGQSLAKWALTWVTERSGRIRFRTRAWKRRKRWQWKEGPLKTGRKRAEHLEGQERRCFKKKRLVSHIRHAERISDCRI